MAKRACESPAAAAGGPGAAIQEKRGAQTVRRVFFAVFAAVFVALFFQVVFLNPHFSYNPLPVVLFALLWGAAAFGAWRLCAAFAQGIARREALVLVCFFAVLIATQVLFYWQVGAYPTRDFERVTTGAVNFAANGFIEEPYLDYFYKFPNNMPLAIVLQFFFRAASRVGFTNVFAVGALLNAGCIAAAYGFVYLCCRRLFGAAKGLFALALLWLCLPLQCYISIFYTDTMTLPFIPCVFYLYLRLLDARTWKGRLAAALLLCAAAALGTKLKYSVAIVLVAVAIDLLLRGSWKKLGAVALGFAVCFAGVSFAFNSYMYAHFLDKSLAADRATPFLSWVAIGLVGDGAYRAEDSYPIWTLPTKAERDARAAEMVKERLAAHTPLSYLGFLNQKGLRSFGSGNLDYTHTAAEAPMRQTFLVECISEGGRYFAVFDTVVQGYHVMLFALVTAGAALAAWKRRYAAFVPYLSIFGLYLFLLFWEAGQRYLLNYYGMFIIAAVFAADALAKEMPRLRRRARGGEGVGR